VLSDIATPKDYSSPRSIIVQRDDVHNPIEVLDRLPHDRDQRLVWHLNVFEAVLLEKRLTIRSRIDTGTTHAKATTVSPSIDLPADIETVT
jgi:hypothetical protein